MLIGGRGGGTCTGTSTRTTDCTMNAGGRKFECFNTAFPIGFILVDSEDWKMSSEEWVWPAMNKAAADKHLLGVKPMVDGA